MVFLQAILLMTVLFLLGGFSTIIAKKFQQCTSETITDFAWYNVVNAIIACVYFGVSSGFSFHLNKVTFIFSICYAACVCCALVVGVCILSRVHISTSSILSSSGSIIVSSVFGILYFGEKLTLSLTFAMIMMLIAAVLPLRFASKSKQSHKKGMVLTVIICVLSFLNGGIVNIITKLYAVNPNVCDTLSFFFFTNVILLVCGVSVLGFLMIKNKIHIKKIVSTFSVKQLLFVASSTAISNISSVLTVMILAIFDVSLYTIIMSSLGIIRSAVLSLCFKERLKVRDWISVALSVGAIIILNI